jgi:hypothetical protein
MNFLLITVKDSLSSANVIVSTSNHLLYVFAKIETVQKIWPSVLKTTFHVKQLLVNVLVKILLLKVPN